MTADVLSRLPRISLEFELDKSNLKKVNYLKLGEHYVRIFAKEIHVFNFYSSVPQESVATIAAKGLMWPILVLE